MKRNIVFMFSGQGSQYYGMARVLYENNSTFRLWMNTLNDIAVELVGRSILDIIYAADKKPHEMFSRVLYTHPALFMVQYSMFRTVLEHGVYPDYLLGSSLGEYIACAAGSVGNYEYMLRIVVRQALILEETCSEGGMLAVLDNERLTDRYPAILCHSEVAAVNTEKSIVLSGTKEGLAELVSLFKRNNVIHQYLAASHAYHSSLIDAAKSGFIDHLESQKFTQSGIPIVSAVSGSKYSGNVYTHSRLWDAIRNKMEFGKIVGTFDQYKHNIYVDLGPTGTLANFLIHNGHSRDQCFSILAPFGDSRKRLNELIDKIEATVTRPDNGDGVVGERSGMRKPVANVSRVRAREGGSKMKAFLFPGQGSQIKGMGEELFKNYDEYVSIANGILGYSLQDLCMLNPDGKLNRTEYTQPALFTVNSLTYLEHLRSGEKKPDYLAGHSLGEYSALFAAGAVSFEDGLKIVAKRGELMSKAPPGSMAAVVGIDQKRLEAILSDNNLNNIDIANYNCPTQFVLSGLRNDIESAGEIFRKLDVMYLPLNVSAAFHSRYMKGIRDEFEQFLSQVTFSDIDIPVISNVCARPYRASELRNNLVNQITGSVKWTETICYLMGQGVERYMEIGPGNVLTKLNAKIEAQARPLAIISPEFENSEEKLEVNSRAPVTISRAANSSKKSVTAGKPINQQVYGANVVSYIDRRKNREVTPDQLGSASFRKAYGVRYPYIAGAMYRGISSVDMVVRMAKSGMMGFLGTGGVPLSLVEDRIVTIQSELQDGQAYGVNLLNSLNDTRLEMDTVDLLLKLNVRHVEAAAYMQNLSLPLVQYRTHGINRDESGDIVIPNKIIAKVSRPEVAEAFLSPPPEKLLRALQESGTITADEADLARSIPMSDDLCVEADSGGHTDQGVAYALMPAMIMLRDRMQEKYRYENKVRVGAAGGIGTPEAAAAAFMLGADFILTGSINQCTVEADTSDLVKDLLQDMNIQDTDYAPAGDMFELGAKVQVLKRGLFFPARANKLYELYRMHNSLDELDPGTRKKLQEKYFGRTFEDIYKEVKDYFLSYDPKEIEKAESNPKHKMALVFRWYYYFTTNLALEGKRARKVDFQIHTGPALGAFNQWVKGTDLEDWRRRHVDEVALKLICETAELLGKRFNALLD